MKALPFQRGITSALYDAVLLIRWASIQLYDALKVGELGPGPWSLWSGVEGPPLPRSNWLVMSGDQTEEEEEEEGKEEKKEKEKLTMTREIHPCGSDHFLLRTIVNDTFKTITLEHFTKTNMCLFKRSAAPIWCRRRAQTPPAADSAARRCWCLFANAFILKAAQGTAWGCAFICAKKSSRHTHTHTNALMHTGKHTLSQETLKNDTLCFTLGVGKANP